MSSDNPEIHARVVANAWADDAFRARLVEDPASTLAAEGIEIPQDVKVIVADASDGGSVLVIPPKPTEGEISEDRLEALAGGFSNCGRNYSLPC